MPTYDYTCSACGHLTEIVHGIHEHGPRFCPECGAEDTMKKAFAAPAVHFKGSGWAKKERSATAAPGQSKSAGGEPKKEGSGATDSSGPASSGAGGTD